MAHSHSHSPAQAPDNGNARRLLWAFIVTAGFMLIEAIGGAISGSLALLADAGPSVLQAQQQMLDPLSETERELFTQLMRKVIEHAVKA